MFKASNLLSETPSVTTLQDWKQAIFDNYQVDETDYIEELLTLTDSDSSTLSAVTAHTVDLIKRVRAKSDKRDTIESFLHQYSLDTSEGVVLMCLAEALLRIPDANSANSLIKDKLATADWSSYLGKSDSWLVNASSWGLVLTGKFVKLDADFTQKSVGILAKTINKAGEPILRTALNQVMKFMGRQFVLGRTINEALKRGKESHKKGYTHSFDMLGEAALTDKDAQNYLEAYAKAIQTLGEQPHPKDVLAPSISIKLSALHPRYDVFKRERVLEELGQRLHYLASLAKKLDVAISIDAEEANRLELSLDLFEQLYRSPVCQGWAGLGIVVQAYSKRALPVLGWLNALATEVGTRIPVRLVKGAYWDSEIKWSQIGGYPGYPVFTRKASSDVSYLACARYLLNLSGSSMLYPQFATHNAQTIASILSLSKGSRDFEFQRLHGMGEVLYDEVLEEQRKLNTPVSCRIYAPVGLYNELLPYLVRRLLENGANSSFIHQLVDENIAPETLAAHPVTTLKSYSTLANHKIPLAPDMYGAQRKNSQSYNLRIECDKQPFMQQLEGLLKKQWHAYPIINGKKITNEDSLQISYCPYNIEQQIGTRCEVNEAQLLEALDIAYKHYGSWRHTPVTKRAECLRKAADIMEEQMLELIAICTQEAGKTLEDGIAEVREAVDFLRYYAVQAEQDFKEKVLPGPTGQKDVIRLEGRGVFACISPWNFPLAIFTGQVAAALAAGNAVLAKPAGQTCIIGCRAVEIFLQAGIPKEVLHFIPGRGSLVGKKVLTDNRIAGVSFTGSTDTAVQINQTLASRSHAPIGSLIAETGGQNCMIIDSSALPEQIVADVIRSAFTSAGQRCSALRIAYIQEEIAPRVLELLEGAMAQWQLGDPSQLATDSGPVIDAGARDELQAHIDALSKTHKLIAQAPLPANASQGYYVPATAFEIDSINDLKQENFGPILHIVRYKSKNIEKVLQEINDYGYGLTLGIHSRNQGFANYITNKIKAGNIYINRDMIGAVVGVQPFGGQGLSGTGPKAGGPYYLHRFCTEKTISNNTSAIGGNTTLLSLNDN
ncbi:MAG: bifunctional proline dehydrogenase/L-glutamate gamma-semialdehyde dehydrogenase [Gammaproteobacteria bacterium CG22_combo_CG10-13_8_21_14_all_40_8]|nr:MAG: bifunctional proline dehydrogenase/L-glutamate gamma-semialdehyde dehydrogenase [Gammaproteobacteria bacterium CG22_combo_CG10-13_8_21_14_all_40_8]